MVQQLGEIPEPSLLSVGAVVAGQEDGNRAWKAPPQPLAPT